MHICSQSVVLAACIMFGATSLTAYAQLPADQTVQFEMRETPTDPDSDVVFIVTLELTASDSDGNSVGWDVTSAEFRQPGTGGDTVWNEASPVVDSPDGLWWVEHADPLDPQVAEFAKAPLLSGTAVAVDPADDDLDYNLEGVTYTPPPAPEEPPFEITGALTYAFTLTQQAQALAEDEDEPVRIWDGDEDS